MGNVVCTGATLKCSMGMSPSVFNALPASRVLGPTPVGTITDQAPFMNILPFGMCQSPSNPSVAAATAAALGVLTPMPCVPVIPAPWVPGSPTVLVGGKPAVTDTSKLMCAWGGVIEVVSAGQVGTQAP